MPDRPRSGTPGAGPDRVVELLYFDDCPHYRLLLPRLRELLRESGVDDPVRMRRVADESAAERAHFLGSPTVRVDGRDVEPGADERLDFGLKCRIYTTGDGLRTTPLDSWIVQALARPHREERSGSE